MARHSVDPKPPPISKKKQESPAWQCCIPGGADDVYPEKTPVAKLIRGLLLACWWVRGEPNTV